MSDESQQLDEVKKKIRVDSKGKKTKRIKCKPGFKINANGTGCVPMSGSEKQSKRKAIKKAVRTRKSKSQAQAKRKRIKALKKRKALGV